MTPNYEYIQNLIKNTLANKPAGHEITPEEHQNIELALLEYAKDLELLQVGTLIGFADANTVPVQPNGTNAAYLNTMPNSATITFHNFRDINGKQISVTTDNEYAALNILFWNAGNKNQRNGWSIYTTPIHISAVADLSYIFEQITLQDNVTTNVTCGGITAGTTIPAGTELKQIIMDMIFTYIKPAVTMSGSGDYEVGTSQNPTIKYKATNSSSANVTKIKLEKIVDGSTSTLETRDPATSGTEYAYNDTSITVNTIYKMSAYDNVKGESSDNTRTVAVRFFQRYFWGYAGISSLPQTSQTVRNLANKGFIYGNNEQTLIGNANTDSQAYYLVVAVPSGYHVTAQNVFGGDYVVELNGTVQVNIGEGISTDTLEYKVYYIGGTPSFKNLKIVKD